MPMVSFSAEQKHKTISEMGQKEPLAKIVAKQQNKILSNF